MGNIQMAASSGIRSVGLWHISLQRSGATASEILRGPRGRGTPSRGADRARVGLCT